MKHSSSYNKAKYNWALSLISRQKTMLAGTDEELSELYDMCDNKSQLDLITDLLIRFNCFEEEIYNLALLDIANYIHSINYPMDKTAIVAFCHDNSADSSQAVLQDLKVPLTKYSGTNILSINRFDKIAHYYNKKGIRHFVAVDEFMGSGQTLVNRYKEFRGLSLAEATIDFCLLAGMTEAFDNATVKGINVHVGYIMNKGITDHYEGDKLKLSINNMLFLESKLAPIIKEKNLNEYSLGYHKTEALYARHNKNIPNNTFPLFWWKCMSDGKPRKILFDRVEDGY